MKNKKNILIALLCVLLLAGGVAVGINWNSWFGSKEQPSMEVDGNSEDWSGNKETYTGKRIPIRSIYRDMVLSI